MNIAEAKSILEECTRHELRDHAFGDREITWFDKAGHAVAFGYFGSSAQEVTIIGQSEAFVGKEAKALVILGSPVKTFRNDETGEDHYAGF